VFIMKITVKENDKSCIFAAYSVTPAADKSAKMLFTSFSLAIIFIIRHIFVLHYTGNWNKLLHAEENLFSEMKSSYEINCKQC